MLAFESFNTVKDVKEQLKKRWRMLAIFLFYFENYFSNEKPAIQYVTKKLIKQEIDRRFNKNSGHICT